MERMKFRLTGNYRNLTKGQTYTVAELSEASNIKLVTLRERLARRGARDVVAPSDLQPVGRYKMVTYLCETESEVLMQSWLRRPIIGLSSVTYREH